MLDTRDFEAARAAIAGAYAPHLLLPLGPVEEFHVRHTTMGDDVIEMSMLEHGIGVEIQPAEPVEGYCVLQPHRGAIEVAGRGARATVGDRAAAVVDQTAIFSTRWQPGVRLSVVRIERQLVNRVLADLDSGDPGSDRRFDLPGAAAPDLGSSWASLVGLAVTALDFEIDQQSELWWKDFQRHLVLAMAALQPSFHASPSISNAGGSPAALRRAVAHIEAHADEPLSVAAVAEAARIGPRALQGAFRRHLGTTPTAYLRSIRLDRARAELAREGMATTVSEVAYRWGFVNLSRFAVQFKEQFGLLPSEVQRGRRSFPRKVGPDVG
ncbi:MAG: helix-turn-helix transcriptional regulator [Solirubrobacterales bacterium]|nr:helix-turn-helix transcriptional regulator [Solirubrobacterales bacterium]